MNKSIKKIVSFVSIAVVTSSMLLSGKASASTLQSTNSIQVESASTAASGSPYGTNPNGGVGKESTIKIDGDFSDWSDSMLIAQGIANDPCTSFKGAWENCVLDSYSLYASWDNDNLYLGWQMVNPADTWWPQAGDGPLSDGGRIGDVPMEIGLSVDPTKKMTGRVTGGKKIWGSLDVTFTTPVDHLFLMSGKAGMGKPAMFSAIDAEGNTSLPVVESENYFSTLGIKYAMAKGFLPSTMKTLNNPKAPTDIYSASASWVDSLKTTKPHDKTLDSFYEMSIPLSVLGINKDYIETNGLGVIQLATRGESAIDCLPNDPSMLDNVMGDYAPQPTNSHEKDDNDDITVPLASIGKIRNAADVTTPVIVPPATKTATETPVIAPATKTATETPEATKTPATTTTSTPATTTTSTPATGTPATSTPATGTPATSTPAELDISKFSTLINGPQTVGKTIKLIAEATGGTGNNQYEFLVNDVVKQSYSSKAYFDWKPTTAGKYNLTVKVKDASGTTIESNTISYTILSNEDTTPKVPETNDIPNKPVQDDDKVPATSTATIVPGTSTNTATNTATDTKDNHNVEPANTMDSNAIVPIAAMMILGAASLIFGAKKRDEIK